MPGTSVSHLIWFIAAIAVAIGVVSALTATVMELSEGLEERTDSLAGGLRGDIEIVNDPQMVPYEQGPGTLHVYLKNTGTTSLDINLDMFVLYVNGTAVTADAMTMVGGSAQWSPGLTVEAEFDVAGLVEGKYYAMKVTAGQFEGVKDTMDFMVAYI